jgi:hypothetical protein
MAASCLQVMASTTAMAHRGHIVSIGQADSDLRRCAALKEVDIVDFFPRRDRKIGQPQGMTKYRV